MTASTAPDSSRISATAAAATTGRRFIDVRTPAEFETGHIPGSVNVPLDLLRAEAARLADQLPRDSVLVCRSGARAGQAAVALVGAGVTGAEVLDGGILAWEQSGGPVERGHQRWELERQVRLVAGSLVLGGVLASTVVPKAKWLSGAVGGGLIFAAVSNTCAMGAALSRLPYNRPSRPTAASVREELRR